MMAEERKATARAWFESLRDRICAAIEALEDAYQGPEAGRLPPGRFERRVWARPPEPGETAPSHLCRSIVGVVSDQV